MYKESGSPHQMLGPTSGGEFSVGGQPYIALLLRAKLSSSRDLGLTAAREAGWVAWMPAQPSNTGSRNRNISGPETTT
jgi:hypothetical protein